MFSLKILHILWVVYMAVNPLSLQILRMSRDVIIHKKDVVGIVTFDQIGLLATNQVTAHISMAYRGL